MNTDTVTVSQEQLDRWRAYAEQMRLDLLNVRQLIARGQGQAAAQLLGGMLDSTLIVGVTLDDAGANRPGTMRPQAHGGGPAGGPAGSRGIAGWRIEGCGARRGE